MDRSKAAVFSVVESVYLMLTFAENAASKRKTGMMPENNQPRKFENRSVLREEKIWVQEALIG